MNNFYVFSVSVLFVFIISACLGSFFKLVVDRYGTSDSYILKSSHCTSCKNKLFWWQNIPIISFLFLRGKCFFCKSEISRECFYSELFTASSVMLMFVVLINKGCNVFNTFFVLFVFLILILLSMFDLKHRIIPHSITYSVIILVLAGRMYLSRAFHLQVQPPLIDLGVAFLSMDFLCLLVSCFKRHKIDVNNLMFAPLLVWTLYCPFYENVYFISVPILLFYGLNYFQFVLPKIEKMWLLFAVIFFLILFKILFLDADFSKLTVLFFGIGIIYFFCEIMFYFISLFLSNSSLSDKSSSHDKQIIAMGGGDITVFALISASLGYKYSFFILFIASLVALLAKQKHQDSLYVPFVPYLTTGFFIIIITIYG